MTGPSTPPADGAGDGLAPIIPLFHRQGDADRGVALPGEPRWHPTWDDDVESRAARVEPVEPETDPETESAAEVDRDHVERVLLRKLRTRSLSVAEVRGLAKEQGLDAADGEDVVDGLVRLGYLDDDALAEQLVHIGVDRKGQGRQAIALTLAKRGVPREVADRALAVLADDDAERALEFARTKARAMRSLDRETAVRRLAGQLARRGYGGSVALSAAKSALDEQSGVRFR